MSTKIPFTKMHGAGNDFVVIDGRHRLPFDPRQFAKRACAPHFGIGADGLLILTASKKTDFGMQYFNADGTESVCGNGVRCLARYIYSAGLVSPETRRFEIETDHTIVHVEIIGKGDRIRVDMGEPIFDGHLIPTSKSGDQLEVPLNVAGEEIIANCVSMGNPHCVIFGDSFTDDFVERIGTALQSHPFFPERVNVEFVKVEDPGHVKVRIWERGVGETLACGTGICAVVAVGVRLGKCEPILRVVTNGGEFQAQWSNTSNRIQLVGPTEIVYRGEAELEALGVPLHAIATGSFAAMTIKN